VSAILNLYQNPDKRRIMAEKAINRAKLFDKKTFTKSFFAALDSI